MTIHPFTPILSRRSLVSMLATGALLAAGAGFAADQASAASAQVLGPALVITGDNVSDRITLRLEAGVPTNLQVDLNDDGTADATFDRSAFSQILVSARRGNDVVRIDDTNGPFTDTEITTLRGGRDDDTLLGGRGVETFLGGAGNDTVDGNQGNDLAFLGEENDTFIWDPGDGSDTIEGQSGYDTLDFRGSGGDEIFDASANGSRLRFFRNLGNIVMDTDDVERVDLTTLGGVDSTTVNNLRRTDVRRVNVNLAGALGAAVGDAQPDSVIVNATPGNDDVLIRPEGAGVAVRGLYPKVHITNSEPANDTLTLNALGGDDTVRFGNGLSGLIKTTVNA